MLTIFKTMFLFLRRGILLAFLLSLAGIRPLSEVHWSAYAVAFLLAIAGTELVAIYRSRDSIPDQVDASA